MSVRFLVLTLILAISACDKPTKPEAVIPEVPMTKEGTIAYLSAQDFVLQGIQRSVGEAFKGGPANVPSGSTIPEDLLKNGVVFSVATGGNNHGETEDCGCKANPLGGLARRASLIQLSSTPEDEIAVKWWGPTERGAAIPVSVDAGDFFYKNVTLARADEGMQEQAKYDAQTAAQALKLIPMDAMLVGELDLVFGLDDLKGLQKTASAQMISANLQDPQGNLIFPPVKRFERSGETIGVLGLTKPTSRLAGFWEERNLRVAPSLESYRAAWGQISDAGLRIFLSNLGQEETRRLLESLAEEERPDLVVVSNSNRLTQHPEWVASRPVLEPLSQGKYGVRVDLFRAKERFEGFKNMSVDSTRATQGYRRAWTTYVAARGRFNKGVRTLLELPDDNADEALASRKEFLEKENNMLWSRVQLAAQDLASASKLLEEFEVARTSANPGEDWIDLRAIQIKLDIPEEPRIKRIVETRKTKRPAYDPHKGHHHANDGHDHHGHSH